MTGAEQPSERSQGDDDAIPSETAQGSADVAEQVRNGEEVVAAVDVHEPDHVWPLLLDHPDVDKWKEVALASADLVINGVGFERKTPEDFASSLTEGRLKEQVLKMGDAFDHAYILIEGEFTDFGDLGHSRLNPQSARGAAASITARYGVPVIPCSTPEVLVDHAVRLARKHNEEPVSGHLPTGPVGSDEPAGKRMWGCLPNVGETMAERLYEEFGGPAEFMADEVRGSGDHRHLLQSVDGIGEKTAERLVTALRGEADE